nr:mucin-17 isoform X2 [Nomia melanderi]XP_031836384.1 mucin-17 isoform X2 [Nomia melanderi]XP_031836385.1 mucin-17 isoform X2 [Nomia melanderi]XP_031836386.1 mucin-17 isoform X2 [Nomia melanderi]
MTRGRRLPPALRVCIGTFLLLFTTVTADTIIGSSSVLDEILASNASVAAKNKTILNKIPSRDETLEFASVDSDRKSISSQNASKNDAESAFSKLANDAKTEDEEKVPTPIDREFEGQGARPRNEVDWSSDSNNASSKYDETLYGTSGKSSSTKTISEESNRLSRTNDLIVATTKPALEESKSDEKTNETIPDVGHHDKNKTNESSTSKEEHETITEKGTSSNESEISKLEGKNVEDRSTTHKTLSSEKLQERLKKTEDLSPTKNVEVPDLKETDENKESSEPISLINDTYVNYSRHYKTSTEKNSGTVSGGQSSAIENATNFISKDSAITQKPRDPKEDVEVVGNATEVAVERIEAQQSQNSTRSLDEFNHSLSPNESLHDPPKSEKIAIETHELIDEKNQQKLMEAATDKSNQTEALATQDASSPVPRGRTIAFSGINEFPNLDTKPTTTSKIDVAFSKKNISSEKLAEQKPYPYMKSSTKEEAHNASNQVVDATTEEASALENTIVRGQPDEKFIVTEASDVLENSIQQFKPTYYEKSSNDSSTVSTTPLRPSVATTTVSPSTSDEARPTNRSVGSIDPATAEGKSSTSGNDVPRWSEGRDAITGSGNFDMTGNGITEVSVKPESADKRTYEPPFRGTGDRTTSGPATQTEDGLNVADVQTNAESSLLIRSTLNATELATEYPLVKKNSSEEDTTIATNLEITTVKIPDNITEPPTTVDTLKNVTETPDTPDTNGTNEIPSGVTGSFSSDDSPVPSTTTIEYEFVGLSETTTFFNPNVTEETVSSDVHGSPSETTTVPTVQDLFGKNSLNETSTVKIAAVTESSLIDETETTDNEERLSASTTEQTTVPISTTNLGARDDVTTQTNVIEEETSQSSTREDEGQKTSSATDSWTTVSEDDAGVTGRTEESFTTDSKDSRRMLNVTETPAQATMAPGISTTGATRVAGFSPFVPSSPRPGITFSSTSSSTPAAPGVPMETTDDTRMSPGPEEITSLVHIVMEGTWNEICLEMEKLRSTLAEVLKVGMKGSVSDKQIMFHRQPRLCPEVASSTPTTSDIPLTSILVYVVDENGKFDSTMTNSLPTLYQDVKDTVKFPIAIHSFRLETIPDSGNAIAVVVVSVVAFICLLLLAGLLFIMRKRQTRFNYGERCRPVSLDAYSVDSVSAYNSVRRKGVARSSKRSYGNPTFEDSSAIPSHPLNFAGLSSFCNDVNAINEEFSGIPQVSAKIDELPAGAEVKNRYANVIPLPETRVPLQKINNDSLTEYINASYVRGPKNAMRYYIACQAPMELTVTDFWRMIWEQQCKVIIMLTDLVENGVEKCTEYIPPSEITDCHRLYGDFQVTLKKRETKEKYAISTLHLKNLENNTFREVYHIWYLWPVNGAQSDGAGLIAVLLEARALQRGGPGPIVVHCSPGTGRTGTLIALDLGIRQYEITRTVDVPRVVYTIRRDRAGAVQTKEQYAFIYKALNLYATKLAGGVLDST